MPEDPTPPVGMGSHPGQPLFYLLVLPNRWPLGQTLHVCFYGGDNALRAKILSVASTWLRYGNLKFDAGGPNGRDCKDKDTSEIRIGFNEPGYWSYIGTDGTSTDLVNQNLASLNLQGFDKAPPPEPRFSGIVLHEFGHALGFHHEHQSPGENCDKEYNWPKLYAYYQQQYGWSTQMVDQNVRQLQADRRAYDWSQPDPKSIMVYASDPQFLNRGTASPCYFHENDILSAQDEVGMARAYPSGDDRKNLQQQISILTMLQSLGPTALSKTLDKQLELSKKRLQALH